MNRDQFHYVGKALEAKASDLGFGSDPQTWSATLVVGGWPTPGELLFYKKRVTAKWATYESAAGRLIRIVTDDVAIARRLPPRNPG